MFWWLPSASVGIIAALPVPAAGQLVCVGGMVAVVPPFAGGVVPVVALAPLVGVFPVVVGVALVLLPPEPQAARRKIRHELIRKSKKR
jgi:hypothetical protein